MAARTAKKTPAKKAPAKKAAAKTTAPAPAGRPSVNAILTNLRAHPETAPEVLEAELASGAPRPSLVKRLERMLGNTRRRGRPAAPDPRLLDVLDARRGGASWRAIATELEYPDPAAAERAFAQAMQMLEVTSVANQILLEHDRLDRIQAMLWPKALRGDAESLDRLMRVLEQRSKGPRPLDNRDDRIAGPVERGTDEEVGRLKKHAPALAAAALVLARAVDDNAGDPEKAASIARELRISMTQLRGLAGTRADGDAEDEAETRAAAVGGRGVVVPQSRLAELRSQVDRGYRAP
jgi:hypothetical protein